MTERCINLRDWESRHLIAHGTLTIVRPVRRWEYDGEILPDGTGSAGYEPDMNDCPAHPGDTLIGRECWAYPLGMADSECTGPADIAFRASAREDELALFLWRSSATMPAWAARHRLTVEGVEVVKVCPKEGLSPKAPFQEVRFSVKSTWPEKDYPWETSYAWVVKARRQG